LQDQYINPIIRPLSKELRNMETLHFSVNTTSKQYFSIAKCDNSFNKMMAEDLEEYRKVKTDDSIRAFFQCEGHILAGGDIRYFLKP